MKKIFNQLKFETQSLLLPTICKTLPLHIQIEPTNHCNLKCPLCVHTRIPDDEKKHLSFEDFKFIIDKFNYHIRIFLTKFGEPFINPDIFKSRVGHRLRRSLSCGPRFDSVHEVFPHTALVHVFTVQPSQISDQNKVEEISASHSVVSSKHLV